MEEQNIRQLRINMYLRIKQRIYEMASFPNQNIISGDGFLQESSKNKFKLIPETSGGITLNAPPRDSGFFEWKSGHGQSEEIMNILLKNFPFPNGYIKMEPGGRQYSIVEYPGNTVKANLDTWKIMSQMEKESRVFIEYWNRQIEISNLLLEAWFQEESKILLPGNSKQYGPQMLPARTFSSFEEKLRNWYWAETNAELKIDMLKSKQPYKRAQEISKKQMSGQNGM